VQQGDTIAAAARWTGQWPPHETEWGPPCQWHGRRNSETRWVPNESTQEGGIPSVHETGTGHPSQADSSYKQSWNAGKWKATSSWTSRGSADRHSAAQPQTHHGHSGQQECSSTTPGQNWT
jgi:hypothetical protein